MHWWKKIIQKAHMNISAEFVLEKYSGHDKVVIVPDGVKKIGSFAFSGNESIKEVILPQSVTEIGASAFRGSSIEKIVIPDSVIKMEDSVFEDCSNLKSVILSDNLKCIECYTFKQCKQLKALKLPSMLKEVEWDAFCDCGITEISIPDSMTYIEKESFQNMEYLEKLNLPSTLIGIGDSAFHSCSSLREVYIPEGVITIGECAFDECSKLEKVVFPKSLLVIEMEAFNGTPIEDSEEFNEVCDRLEHTETYPIPDGYQEMYFNQKRFYYQSKRMEKEYSEFFDKISEFTQEEWMDAEGILENAKGEKIYWMYASVPTFDSHDREWDSYRKFYLIPEKKEITGVMVSGGSRIANVYIYRDVRWADKRTEEFMRRFLG